MLDVEVIYTIAAWTWIVMAFLAGWRGLRQSVAMEEKQTRYRTRLIRLCVSLCFLVAASAIIASAIVKVAVR